MATIDDVIKWAGTLPAWQGDLARRLLLSGGQPLNAADYDEVLALAKAELKLAPAPPNLKPVPLAASGVSGAPTKQSAIKLLAIEEVRNVNIIKSDQTLPFAENGMTVVYGDNGAGKSGYARILKLACQSRDKDEAILPDVFAKAATGSPSATLKIEEGSAVRSIRWTQGDPADPVLANVSVFDGRCARVITDDRNEVVYLPYGGDIFQRLVEVILRVRVDLEAELTVEAQIQDSAVQSGTKAAAFLDSISAAATDEALDAATEWTPQDELALSRDEALARDSDPATANSALVRLETLRRRADDAADAVAALAKATELFTAGNVRSALVDVRAALSAHATAVAERETPEPLPGVASTDQWAVLYEAARQYSEHIAYPGADFPRTDHAVCVLCQQPLGDDAVARFGRFKKYMQDATHKSLEAARKSLRALRTRLETLVPSSGTLLDLTCEDIAAIDEKTAATLRTYHTSVEKRKLHALALLHEGEDPENAMLLSDWPDSVELPLREAARVVEQKAAEIRRVAKPEAFANLVGTIGERMSRRALSARKHDIAALITTYRRNADIRRALATLRTQDINLQGKTILRKNLTPDLLRAFKNELTAMGATRVPISLKTRSEAGETVHEMQLEGAHVAGRVRMSEILSEGESRVIAIAGFLAELGLAPHLNAIVFDDPVSSLDHVFTELVAKRLAIEASTRQVIVFTHNIAFLMELKDAALELARRGTPTSIEVRTLRRTGPFAGVTTGDELWSGLKTKQRAHHLLQLVDEIAALHPHNMADYNFRAAQVYGLLREAWESCVEDDMLYSVVCRYRNGVQTLKLFQVEIADSDIHTLDLNMTKTSTWMTGHDRSKALHTDRPAPADIRKDIEALRVFSQGIVKRREATKSRRESQLKPS